MGATKELDDKLRLLLHPDDDLTPVGIESRDNLIEHIESMHDKVVVFRGSNSRYANIINDLTFSLSLWLSGHEMCGHDHEKIRALVRSACFAIGKPRTIEELAKMLGLNMDGTPIIDEEQ